MKVVGSAGDGAYDLGTRKIWTETFTLDDNDEEVYDRTPSVDVVTIDVTGARDAAGNLQEDYTPQTEFDIDTLQPTMVDATSTSPDGCYIAGATIDVDLTFSEDVVLNADHLRLVLVNALRTLRGAALGRLIEAGNVYFEISVLEGVGGISKLLEGIPLDRLLFGSHFPFFNLEAAVMKLRESELRPAQIEAITHANAERLLRA